MGGLSLTHLLILLVVIVIMFGAGKLPRAMGDIGRGLRYFRDGLKGHNESDAAQITPKVAYTEDVSSVVSSKPSAEEDKGSHINKGA
jgi:sec-independent protein translocase protein TatA